MSGVNPILNVANGSVNNPIEFKPVLDYNALEPGKGATDAIRKAAVDLDFATKYQARVRLTGPVPIANSTAAAMKVVMLESMIVASARVKPASMAVIGVRPPRTSSRMRS